MSAQKATSINNTDSSSQKTKRPRRKRFNLEDEIVYEANMDSVFNLTFKEILRMHKGDDFASAVRSYFVDKLEFIKDGMDGANQGSGEHLKEYFLYKAKIAVIDLMLSDDIQQIIRAASEGEKSPTTPSSEQEAGVSQHAAE
jgi:hypothetical protein